MPKKSKPNLQPSEIQVYDGKRYYQDADGKWWHVARDKDVIAGQAFTPRAVKRLEASEKIYGKVTLSPGPGHPIEIENARNVSLTVPDAIYQWVEKLCASNNRNRSEMLRYMLEFLYKHGEVLPKVPGAGNDPKDITHSYTYGLRISQAAWISDEAAKSKISKSEFIRKIIDAAKSIRD